MALKADKHKQPCLSAFEEWFNSLNNCYTTGIEKRMQQTAWKAALEWVLNDGTTGCDELDDLQVKIEEELNE